MTDSGESKTHVGLRIVREAGDDRVAGDAAAAVSSSIMGLAAAVLTEARNAPREPTGARGVAVAAATAPPFSAPLANGDDPAAAVANRRFCASCWERRRRPAPSAM